jgi:hypothetical protein
MGIHIGVYSSEYEWGATGIRYDSICVLFLISNLVGGYTGFNQYPLWYAHWDGVQSFSDGLYKFGGTPVVNDSFSCI